ncbi:MAG: NAD+ synthase [Elusimicrobiota bacterium]
MRIAIAQINSTVGDIENNARKMLEWAGKAKDAGADVVVFPEMALTGYPPEDLLLKPDFVKDNLDQIKHLAANIDGITAVAGFADKSPAGIHNAAAVISGKKILGVYRKMYLPNYGVFDEKRYFAPGSKTLAFSIGKIKAGINICEDIWQDNPASRPLRKTVLSGAKLVFVINASPYHAGKVKEREKLIQAQAKRNKVYIVYVNMVGGQDELVFDGYSMAADPSGRIIARAEGFKEDLLVIDIPFGKDKQGAAKNRIAPVLAPVEEVYNALKLGLKDYIHKNGFKKAVIGLSGGIDSALVAALAADAIGRENVYGVFMPSRYTSGESKEDAFDLAKNLGIKLLTIPIEDIFGNYLRTLEPVFKNMQSDITEENLQARIRGNLMMALSNKFGWLVLTTGNKSEMSTGYATLYGDMAGGFAVIKDVPKTLVYELSGYRNSKDSAIPARIIKKEPTAELRHGQKDSDSLPPYPELDPILKLYVEEDKNLKDIAAKGFPAETVSKVFLLVDKSEYKRRQSPPGIKITPRAFGRDRRMPITNKYK